MRYTPKYKPNQIICGHGHISIVTGWMVKEIVAKKLELDEYASIAQLYSASRGINFLVRNLLLNPQVTTVVVLKATKEDTNSGSCQCLIDFFLDGYHEGISEAGKKCWVINSSVKGYIDYDIPASALNSLRFHISLLTAHSLEYAISTVKALSKLDSYQQIVRESLEFPLVETLPTTLPGSIYGQRVEGKTIAETWVKIIQRIKTFGIIRSTGYDGQWQELIDLVAIVTDEPIDFYFPEPNYLPCDREFINSYLPQMVNDAPYKEGVKYSYGQRLRSWFGVDQIEQVIEKLIKEPDAASAVMSLWDVKDHETGGSPCLNHIWLRIVDNKLTMTAIFRSNDMFSAWVSNAMGLRALQWHIWEQVNEYSVEDLEVGNLITISQSAHIYSDCWENADYLIDQQYSDIIKRETKEYYDPVGNFVIEVTKGVIKVTHVNSSGEWLAEFSRWSPLELCREICERIPTIKPSHAAYLGCELQKAAIALAGDRQYIQDRPLSD